MSIPFSQSIFLRPTPFPNTHTHTHTHTHFSPGNHKFIL